MHPDHVAVRVEQHGFRPGERPGEPGRRSRRTGGGVDLHAHGVGVEGDFVAVGHGEAGRHLGRAVVGARSHRRGGREQQQSHCGQRECDRWEEA